MKSLALNLFASALITATLISPSHAMRVTGNGGYSLEGAAVRRGWRGVFDVVGRRVTGTVSLDGIPGLADVEIEGALDPRSGDVRFRPTNKSGNVGEFSGHVTDRGVWGQFTLAGTKRVGTWEGSWEVAPGVSPPVVEDKFVEPEPRFKAVSGAWPSGPGDPEPNCHLLDYGPLMLIISGGAESFMRQRCRAEMAPLGPQSLDWWLERLYSLLPGIAPSQWAFEMGRPAFAQSSCGAQANPVNCPQLDTYPFITQSEVSLGVSGSSVSYVVAAYNDSALATGQVGVTSFIGYSWSTDNGNTWLDMGALTPSPDGGVGSDPVVGSDSAGRFYLAYIYARLVGLAEYTSIAVSQSTDNGATFPIRVLGTSEDPSSAIAKDKPEMAVDRRASGTNAGNIYLCWTQVEATTRKIMFARSTNHGSSFTTVSPPLTDSPDVTQGCSIAVGPTGNVYVAWWDGTFNNLRMRRSTDGGATFSPTVSVIGSAVPPPCDYACGGTTGNPCGRTAINGDIRLLPFANLAADPLDSNLVYSTWNNWNTSSQKEEINFRRSTDGGLTWSTNPILRLNDDTFGDKFLPRMATVPDGSPASTKIRVMWYDRRNDDPHNLWPDVYQTTSTDSGQTWQMPNTRLTDAPLPLPRINPNFDCRVQSCYFGDYNGLTPVYSGTTGAFIEAWGDTRTDAGGISCRTGQSEINADPNVWAFIGC